MGFRELNRRKNNWLREQKGKWAAFFLGKAEPVSHSLGNIHKILVLRNDNKLGDMVCSSVLFRGLKQLFPQSELDVVAWKDNAPVVKNCSYLSHIVQADESFFRLARLGATLRAKQYDLFIDTDEKPTLSSLTFLKLLAPRLAFGFNRSRYPLYNLNETCDLSRWTIAQRYEAILRKVGFRGAFDSHYEITIPAESFQRAAQFFSSLPASGRVILLNPLAASVHRSFTLNQVKEITRLLSADKVILVGKKQAITRFLKGFSAPNLYTFSGAQNVLDSVAFGTYAQALLTVDTFWVHVACALQIPTVAVYRDSIENRTVWGPNDPCVKVLVGEQPKVPAEKLVQLLP